MAVSNPRFVLDSFALLAHFQNEPGAARVRSILEQGSKQAAELYVSIVNYGEVVYIIERAKGIMAARTVIAALDQLPLQIVAADRALTLAAAHLKAQHPIAYADAFAVALAQSKDAILLTGDPELKAVQGQTQIEWLPQK